MSLAAQVAAPGARYEIVEREVPEPGPGQVRIKVHACGFCHSDENIRRGWIGNEFPRVPGHEAAGTIEAVGAGVPDRWREGDRVGVGWHGGHCQNCDRCREGHFVQCEQSQGCGSSYDGGFAEHLVVPHTGLVRIPDAISFAHAGPVMCGGITVWNGLRRTEAQPGDLVAIQGIGGLGHMAVQYADKMGFETVAISRGEDKAALAHELGADHYIDAAAGDPAKALQALGGAQGILCTAPSGEAMNPLFSGLGLRGRMSIVGVSGDTVGAPAYDYLGNEKGIVGSVIGTPRQVERLLRFSAVKDIAPLIETFPLTEIHAAQEKLLANELRFRAVFQM